MAFGTLNRFCKSSVCMWNETNYRAFCDSLLKRTWLLRLGFSLERGDGCSISVGCSANMLV